jgi:hypothetical protein
MRNILFIFALLLVAGCAFGSITRVAANCTGTSSCTTTGNAIGDLEIAYAGVNLSATAPTVATGWTSVGTGTINGTSTADSAVLMACKVATGTSEASNTFTNATSLIIMVYRGQKAGTTATCASAILGTPSFFTSTVNTTSTTETFNAITNSSGDSFDAGFGYCSACTAGIATAPTAMSNQNSITGPPGMGGHDTNAGGSSFSSANVTLTTAGRIITGTVEIKATCTGICHVTTNAGTCSAVAHTGNVTVNCNTVSSFTFTYTASSAASGEIVMVAVGCDCGLSTTISLSASGWAFTQIGSTIGTNLNRTALFRAYVPNTSAATITATFTGGTDSAFANDLIDEFSGADTSNPVDASNSSASSGSCTSTVTPTVNDDMLYGTCQDTVTAVGTAFTKGADDASTDWAEYKKLSGQSGVSQTVNFTGSGTYQTFSAALKPPSAVTCSNFISLMGAGCR